MCWTPAGGASTASRAAVRAFGRERLPSNVFMTRSSARISVNSRVLIVLLGCVLWLSLRRTNMVSTTLMPTNVVKRRNQPSVVTHFFSRASSDCRQLRRRNRRVCRLSRRNHPSLNNRRRCRNRRRAAAPPMSDAPRSAAEERTASRVATASSRCGTIPRRE